MSSRKCAFRQLLKWSNNSTSRSIAYYLSLNLAGFTWTSKQWMKMRSMMNGDHGSVLDTMSSKYVVSHLTLTKQQWQMEPSSTTKEYDFSSSNRPLAHDTCVRQTMWFHVSSRWYMVWILYRLLNIPAWSWHLGTFIRIVPAWSWYWVKDGLLGRMRQVHTWYWNW
jgi:hypothetical protein